MDDADRLLIEQLKVVVDHCEETGLKSGAVAVENAIAELTRLKEQLDREAWQHAACLTIAEGCKDYDKPTWAESAAIKRVRELRVERDTLAAKLGPW